MSGGTADIDVAMTQWHDPNLAGWCFTRALGYALSPLVKKLTELKYGIRIGNCIWFQHVIVTDDLMVCGGSLQQVANMINDAHTESSFLKDMKLMT